MEKKKIAPRMGTHPEHVHISPGSSDRRLIGSIVLNLVITAAEVIGGILSGSLALLSDALHNFNDSTSLLISLISMRVSRRNPDRKRTFGYHRAEILGALFNLGSLVVVAFFLIKEAIERYLDPQPINGVVMFSVAVIGLLANLATAALLYRQAKESLNIQSAFVHIVSDALSSVGVIIAGLLVIFYDLYIADTLLTLLISAYILIQSYQMLRQTVRILMQSMPEGLEYEQIVEKMQEVEGVEDIHHLHVWQLDEDHTNLEAHIVINSCSFEEMNKIKLNVKERLHEMFGISHSTLEFEFARCDDCASETCYETHISTRSDR